MTTPIDAPKGSPDGSPPDPIDLSVQALDLLLSSASTDVIGVNNWWDRARAALETAAAGADDWPHAVSIACRKLQIDVLSDQSARGLTGMTGDVTEVFEEWREIATRDAHYIVAMVRVIRADRTANRKKGA